MVNYACAFSQSELGKYFEWIIKLFNKLSKIYKKINTSDNSSQNSLIYFILVILTSSSWFHSNNSSGIFSGRVWKKIGDHLGSYLGWFWGSFWVGDHFGSCTNLKARPGATRELDVEFKLIPETLLQALLPFPSLQPELPGELARKLPWT